MTTTDILAIALIVTVTFCIILVILLIMMRASLIKSISTIEEQRALLGEYSQICLKRLKTINDQEKEIESLKEKIVNVDNLREADQKTFKQKLQYAINNTPKFKVGDVVKNVRVVEVDVEITSNLSMVLQAAFTGLMGGFHKAIETYYKQREKDKYFNYKIESTVSKNGVPTFEEWKTEEELIALKKSKSKSRK